GQRANPLLFNHASATWIYPLSLHDALPISRRARANRYGRVAVVLRDQRLRRDSRDQRVFAGDDRTPSRLHRQHRLDGRPGAADRSEEHTSELQSLAYLVCRLLLEKKKNIYS